MKIVIETIPHEKQRYNTTDDWKIDDEGNIYMTVSEQNDFTENAKEVLHGLTECLLCIKHGISQKVVDDWDLSHLETDDPGNYKDAPYHLEHIAGNIAEDLMDL